MFQRSWGLMYGRLTADPYENYMAASRNCGVLSVGIPNKKSATTLGLYSGP